MKAVQRQNDVEGVVCIGGSPPSPLRKGTVFRVRPLALPRMGVVSPFFLSTRHTTSRSRAQRAADHPVVIKTFARRPAVPATGGFSCYVPASASLSPSYLDLSHSLLLTMITVCPPSPPACSAVDSIKEPSSVVGPPDSRIWPFPAFPNFLKIPQDPLVGLIEEVKNVNVANIAPISGGPRDVFVPMLLEPFPRHLIGCVDEDILFSNLPFPGRLRLGPRQCPAGRGVQGPWPR